MCHFSYKGQERGIPPRLKADTLRENDWVELSLQLYAAVVGESKGTFTLTCDGNIEDNKEAVEGGLRC